jgi:hypothetical protein
MMTKVIKYAVTEFPTPVFNTPDLSFCFGGKDGNTLFLDEKELMRSIETVLFPQSRVELLEHITHTPIWRIQTPEYPYPGSYYIDERFIWKIDSIPDHRISVMPKKQALVQQLKNMKHCRYVWGGNWPKGIELLTQLYPSRAPITNPLIQDTWSLKGLDCSGLPHYLTNGATPRNTSSLVTYGKAVEIEGKNLEEIIASLHSLDFIVWTGHVVWVIDQQWSIESKYPEGLVKFKLKDRLTEILQERKPLNEWQYGAYFVVRRWHPETLHL